MTFAAVPVLAIEGGAPAAVAGTTRSRWTPHDEVLGCRRGPWAKPGGLYPDSTQKPGLRRGIQRYLVVSCGLA